MKSNRIVLKAVAAAALASTAGFAAAVNTSVPVTASVSSVCTVGGTQSTIVIPAIDPSLVASAPTKDGDIVYRCTKGTTPSITFAGGGTRTLTHTVDSSKTISYTFSLATPGEAGKGFSAAATSKVVATATISLAAAQDAEAGSYADAVTVTIAP